MGRQSSNRNYLAASMPPGSGGGFVSSSAADDMEARIRRKLEDDEKERAGKSRASSQVLQGASGSAKDSFEERLRRKMEEGEKGVGKSKGTSNRTTHLSRSMVEPSPSMSVGYKASESTKDSFEERLRRKLEKEEEESKTRKSKGNSNRSTHMSRSMVDMPSRRMVDNHQVLESANETFEERLRRKLEKEENEQSKSKSGKNQSKSTHRLSKLASFDERILRPNETDRCDHTMTEHANDYDHNPCQQNQRSLSNPDSEVWDDSAEVKRLRKKLAKGRSVRIHRPRGLSSSLPPNYMGHDDSASSDEDGSGAEERNLTLDERIQLKKKKIDAKKGGKVLKNSKKNRDLFKVEETAETTEEAKERMTKRSVRAGLNRGGGATELKTKDPETHPHRRELLVRSCSSSNCVSGSWECNFCTFINEPVNGESLITCKMCGRPHQEHKQEQPAADKNRPKRRVSLIESQEASMKLVDLVAEDNSPQGATIKPESELGSIVSKKPASSRTEGILIDSWSELGDVIELAKKASKMSTNPKPFNRRSTDAECWVCNHCAYRNLDGRAVFCGTCGKGRCT